MPGPEFYELISRLALALGIGLLFGVERGWRTRRVRPGSRAAGIRTFSISGLLGGSMGALTKALGATGGALALGLGLAAFAAVMAMFCRDENRSKRSFSATTWVALVLTFSLGAYAILGDMYAAAAMAVAATIVLALRDPIHGWVAALSWAEIRSALVILAMTCIVLPLVPDQSIGPMGGINPRIVWVTAILLAGASFAGYAAVKYLGTTRGLVVAGVAGGLVSSTLVTVNNARQASAAGAPYRLLVAGVAAANSVMLIRICAIAAVLNNQLFILIWAPLLAAAAVGAIFAYSCAHWEADSGYRLRQYKLPNPLSFTYIVGFAAFLSIMILAGHIIAEWYGGTGALVGAALVGLFDVDAVTVSLAQLAPRGISLQEAAIAVLAAAASDTLSKAAIGAAIGRGRFALSIAALAATSIAAAATVWWLFWAYLH
jgi:uncharacterized membrane protein (DUF4010 family)